MGAWLIFGTPTKTWTGMVRNRAHLRWSCRWQQAGHTVTLLGRTARVLDTAGRVEQFRRRYGTNAKGA